jgi:hypothetical protein
MLLFSLQRHKTGNKNSPCSFKCLKVMFTGIGFDSDFVGGAEMDSQTSLLAEWRSLKNFISHCYI